MVALPLPWSARKQILTPVSPLRRVHLAVAHLEPLRARPESLEQVFVGAGEPGLTRVRKQFVKQRRAAHRIQVRGSFIDEN